MDTAVGVRSHVHNHVQVIMRMEESLASPIWVTFRVDVMHGGAARVDVA